MSEDDRPEKVFGDDGLEVTCLEIKATQISEHWLRRQFSVLFPWQVPQARCI